MSETDEAEEVFSPVNITIIIIIIMTIMIIMNENWPLVVTLLIRFDRLIEFNKL